jgi:hypothetical protein
VRLTEARYTRDQLDLLRYRLGLRLLRTDARNRTIQRWTGLSMARVRTLREYAADGSHSEAPRRGVAPHQPAIFFRSAVVKSEAVVLAGFLHVFGVMPTVKTTKPEDDLPSPGRGMRLCNAYAQFMACVPMTKLSIERAMLLLIELTKNVELTLDRCRTCEALVLVDRLAVSEPLCALCQQSPAEWSRVPLETSRGEESDDATGVSESDPPLQGSLF